MNGAFRGHDTGHADHPYEIGQVEVWQIPLDGPDGGRGGPADEEYPAVWSAWEDLLDDDEKARARMGLRPGMRRRFVIAHAAARIIVGARLGRAPEAVRFTRGRWGKPGVAAAEEFHFSLSHSGDLALVALAPRPVGVDVELTRADLDISRLSRRYFPRKERELVEREGPGAFGRLWTRKEACVKAAGGRLTQGMELAVAHDECQTVVHAPHGPLPGPWRVADLSLPENYSGAVALMGDGPFCLSRKMWYPIPPVEPEAKRIRQGVK